MATLIGAGLALILLGLYAYAICIVCSAPQSQPNEATETLLSTVGGLVSSLVVSVLAITPAAVNPSKAILLLSAGKQPQEGALRLMNIIVGFYFVTWLVCGGALWFSWLRLEAGQGASSALKSAAKSWLGLMIAAGFAYFGLKQG